jgi:hypothetical protein
MLKFHLERRMPTDYVSIRFLGMPCYRIHDFLVINMPTLLVRNVPDRLLRELKKRKAELGCKTWAELLSELAAATRSSLVE